MTEWQPIETAPKDGTVIIVWREAEDDRMRIGFDLWKNGLWWKSRRKMQPTHWMPLPKPPRNYE